MLEFNQEHKAADLSAIKSKTEKIKNVGKVMICGIVLSSVLLLSGCSPSKTQSEVVDNSTPAATAIIITNDNALLVDLSEYDNDYSYGQSVADVRDMDGDRLLLGHDYTIIVTGENSHQKAEEMAEGLIGDKGEIICYDEAENHGKTR